VLSRISIDLISGGKAVEVPEPEPEPEPDEELFDGGATGRTTEELALTPDVPAAFVAVDENV
jgi:hypothetical protein